VTEGSSARVDPEIRLATIDDLAAIRSILALHNNDGPVVVADIVGPYMRYLISRGRTYVALVDDAIVGFGSGLDTGRSIHLADLFVHPDHLGRGIGRPILAAARRPAGPRTTFASEDPRALPIYVRAGMTPLWPSLYLQGAVTALPDAPGSLTAHASDADELIAIERKWTGRDRADDHRYWAAMPGADTFTIRDGAEVVAIGHARSRQLVETRVLDRLVIHPDADPVATTLVALARAGGRGEVMACLLGPHPALRPLLDAGFHVVDRDQFMASDSTLVDPERLIPNPGML
jgi:GNAT superfamily N-acetyltransferase